MKKILVFLLLASAANCAQAQSIYRQNGEDYANIVPVAVGGFKAPVYLTRIHVRMPNDGTVANISYELQYSEDSLVYKASSMHSGSFTMPVDGDLSPNEGKVNVFNYIKGYSKITFEWAGN